MIVPLLGFLAKKSPKLASQYLYGILAVLVRHNSAQKGLQSGPKHFFEISEYFVDSLPDSFRQA